MNIIDQRDQLFSAAQNLSFDDLKQLCQTNRDYRTLCSEPRFQELIQERFKETPIAKVQNILQQIKDAPDETTFVFTLVQMDTVDSIVHELDIYKNEEGTIESLGEIIVGFPLEKSFLYQHFKKLMKFKGIENYTPDEYRKVAELMYQDQVNEYKQEGVEPNHQRITPVDSYINKPYGKYFLLDRLMRRYNNLPINQSDVLEQRSINVRSLGREYDAAYTIDYPTDSDLRDVFTQMIEHYPNYTMRTH